MVGVQGSMIFINNCSIPTMKGDIIEKFICEYSFASDRIKEVHRLYIKLGSLHISISFRIYILKPSYSTHGTRCFSQHKKSVFLLCIDILNSSYIRKYQVHERNKNVEDMRRTMFLPLPCTLLCIMPNSCLFCRLNSMSLMGGMSMTAFIERL